MSVYIVLSKTWRRETKVMSLFDTKEKALEYAQQSADAMCQEQPVYSYKSEGNEVIVTDPRFSGMIVMRYCIERWAVH